MNNSPADIVLTAFDRISIKLRAFFSRSKHFVNVARFVYLAKGFVHTGVPRSSETAPP